MENLGSPKKKMRGLAAMLSPSTVAVEGKTSETLVIDIEEVADTNGNPYIQLLFPSGHRPKTNPDLPGQGDHVTAYVSYLQMLITAVEDRGMKEGAVDHVMDAAFAIFPDNEDEFVALRNKYNYEVRDIMTRNDINKVIEGISLSSPELVEKTTIALNLARRTVYMQALKHVCKGFLDIANKHPEVAFARKEVTYREDSNGKLSERTSRNTLNAINISEKLSIENINEKSEDYLNNLFDSIYNKLIQTNARYKEGFNKLFGGEAEGIKNFFGGNYGNHEGRCRSLELFIDRYARIRGADTGEFVQSKSESSMSSSFAEEFAQPKSSTSSSYSLRSKSETSVKAREVKNKESFVNLVSSCFDGLFDFNLPIDSGSREMFYRVSARHIVCMFHAFGFLKNLEEGMRDGIIDKFLENTVSNRRGRGSSSNVSTIRDGMDNFANLSQYRMKIQESSDTNPFSAALVAENYDGSVTSTSKSAAAPVDTYDASEISSPTANTPLGYPAQKKNNNNRNKKSRSLN